MARRRFSPFVIRLDPNVRTKSGMRIRGKVLSWNTSPENLAPAVAEIARLVTEGVRKPKGRPKRSTVRRRGRGRLWRVTKRLINGIETKRIPPNTWQVVGPPGRLGADFTYFRLRQTVPILRKGRVFRKKSVKQLLQRYTRPTIESSVGR